MTAWVSAQDAELVRMTIDRTHTEGHHHLVLPKISLTELATNAELHGGNSGNGKRIGGNAVNAPVGLPFADRYAEATFSAPCELGGIELDVPLPSRTCLAISWIAAALRYDHCTVIDSRRPVAVMVTAGSQTTDTPRVPERWPHPGNRPTSHAPIASGPALVARPVIGHAGYWSRPGALRSWPLSAVGDWATPSRLVNVGLCNDDVVPRPGIEPGYCLRGFLPG